MCTENIKTLIIIIYRTKGKDLIWTGSKGTIIKLIIKFKDSTRWKMVWQVFLCNNLFEWKIIKIIGIFWSTDLNIKSQIERMSNQKGKKKLHYFALIPCSKVCLFGHSVHNFLLTLSWASSVIHVTHQQRIRSKMLKMEYLMNSTFPVPQFSYFFFILYSDFRMENSNTQCSVSNCRK